MLIHLLINSFFPFAKTKSVIRIKMGVDWFTCKLFCIPKKICYILSLRHEDVLRRMGHFDVHKVFKTTCSLNVKLLGKLFAQMILFSDITCCNYGVINVNHNYSNSI